MRPRTSTRPARRADPRRRTAHASGATELVTPDGRYMVVKGRLWRLSDPTLSAERREELVRELMRARRSIAAAKRSGDEDAERKARREVHQVKVALGERGPVWWSDGAPDLNRRVVANTPYASWFERAMRWEALILSLLSEREGGRSICPSEVARRFDANGWRKYMHEVRDAARRLARRGAVLVTQGNATLDPNGPWRGAIRIRPGATPSSEIESERTPSTSPRRRAPS